MSLLKVRKLRGSIAIISLLLALPVAMAQVVPRVSFDEVSFYFDEPKSKTDYFYANKSVEFIGDTKFRNIKGLEAIISGNASSIGLTAHFQRTSRFVPANETVDSLLTFKIPSKAKARLYEGQLTINGENVDNITEAIKVRVEYPPPTVRARWSKLMPEKLIAGQSYSPELVVSEFYGYRDAGDISVSFFTTGPVDVGPPEKSFSLQAGKSKKLVAEVEVHNSSLIPGNYTIQPQIEVSETTILKSVGSLNYTIPPPVMEIGTQSIDFGKNTFEAGKDISQARIALREKGGYTPLEDIRISIREGEEGWISVEHPGYLAPNESGSINLTLKLPAEASLGRKGWEFSISSRFVSPERITARTLVYFPGLEEAERKLQKIEPLEDGSALQKTLVLVRMTKNRTQLKSIAGAMSVYNGVVAFHKILSSSYDTTEERAEQLLHAGSSLSRVEAAGQILAGGLKTPASEVHSSLEGLWLSETEEVIKKLEEKAQGEKGENLKAAALHFKLLGGLSELSGIGNSEHYRAMQRSLEEDYRKNLSRGTELSLSSETEFNELRGSHLWLGDNLIILNPFAYEGAIAKLEETGKNSRRAEQLFSLAGEKEELTLQEKFTARVEGIEARAEKIFKAYISLLTMLFLGYIARLALGLQRYKRDLKELGVGDIVLAPEEES